MRFHFLLGFLACIAVASQAKPTWPDDQLLQPQVQFNQKQSELSWPELLMKLQKWPVLQGRPKNWPPKNKSNEQNSSPWRGKSTHRLVDQRWPASQNLNDRYQKWQTVTNGPPNSPAGEVWTYSKDTGFMEKMPDWYQPQGPYLDEPRDWRHTDDGRAPVPVLNGLNDYSAGQTVGDWRYRDEVRPKVPNGIRLDDYFSNQTPSALNYGDEVRPKVPNGVGLDDYLSEHRPNALQYIQVERSKVPNGIGSGNSLSGRAPEAWPTLSNAPFGYAS